MDDEQSPPRYVVGIDLGTTNSAMCCIDTHRDDWQIECFAVTQAIAQGESEKRETLPSFHYEPTADELKAGTCELPWQQEHSYCVGVFARDNGRSTPGRMVESAKSWLCHAGVDRRAALLPWHPAEDVERLSPVQVSSRFLRHLREAWDHSHPQYPLSKQDVVLTIPASFDEVARELTVTAAREAGLPRIFLIEEPQAAFYSWVDAHRETWEQIVSPGQKILVCDIGGGTSDFSLIHVRSGENGKLQFHRVAVGDHLLLGGDNLDLALAHHIEQKLADEGKLGGENKLSPRQWSTLISACRHAKETLLDFQAPESYTVVLPGSGSKLIGGSLQTDVTQQELHNLFVEGFLPEVELTDKPAKRQSGFQEFGLPYAPDPAMTKYLAHFLNSHHQTSGSSSIDEDPLIAARPDVVLFNGGFFASPILRSRLINCLQRWFANTSESDKPWSPLVLKNDRLDLAVARGAAYFGMVRRGIGIRIVAGLARSYYIGVEKADGSPAAMCLIAAGTEPGAEPTVLDQHFRVRTSEPVEFPIYVSGTRLTDQPGQLLAIDPEQLTPLPPIRTVLTSRSSEDNTIDARVSVRLNEIGTLEMWCQQVDSTRRWQLQFDVRSATETDREAHTGIAERTGIVDDSIIRTAEALIESTFADESTASPDRIAKQIAAELQISRNDWPPSLLRGMWPALMASESARRRSPKHECRWLNLTGFCLRPGFGMAADDWRVEETWKTLRGKLAHSGSANLTEWRILCRRVAGGLNAGRQNQLAAPLLSAIRQKHRQMMTGRGKATDYASSTHEAAEIWRLLGSLERISSSVRAELGGIIIDLLPRAVVQPIRPSMLWALGRLGARIPIYGPLNLVLPAQTIVPWIEHLLRNEDLTDSVTQLALMQLGRRTDDRYRDISAAMRDRVVAALSQAGAKPHIIELVTNVGQLEQEEANQIFGESLPAGLRIG
ncbi:MAG: Hsp70 family protein [Planctomycetaceae bacterium]|nr:Hsp70 family protein [Planctomycetaceae bacterium]